MEKLCLTEGKISKVLILYSLPLVASNLVFAITNIVDISFVMRFSDSIQGSAVGIGGQVLYLSITLMLGLSVGGTIAIGCCKNKTNIGVAMGSIVTIMLLGAIIFAFGQLLLARPLMNFMKVDDDIATVAFEYIKITAIAVPFVGLNNILLSYYYGRGNSIFPLIVFAIGGALNILLNYIAVGIMDMGAVGSAYAFIVSNVIAFLISGCAIIIDFNRKKIKIGINIQVIKRILCLAMPIAILNVVATLSFMSLTRFATIFASGAVAVVSAHLIAVRYNSMIILPSRSLASGVTAVSANNLSDEDRLKDTQKYGLIFATIFGGIFAIITALFATQLIALFCGESVDLGIGTSYLRILAVDCFAVPISVVLFALLDGKHHTTTTMIISLISSLSRPIFACLIGEVWGLGIYGVAVSIPTATLLGVAIVVPTILLANKHKKQTNTLT